MRSQPARRSPSLLVLDSRLPSGFQAKMAGDKKQPSQSQQSTLSAFFAPSQQPKRPSPASTSDILILSDSDDDDSAEQQQQPFAKKVKIEHTASQPSTHQQRLSSHAASPSAPPPAPAPAPAPSRHKPSAKVLQWRYDPNAPPSSSADPSTSINGSTAQREKLARKLLGKNLLQRKTAYLQEDHFMAVNSEASGSGSRSPAFGLSGEDDEDADSFGAEDGEESDEREVVGKGKGKATANGKRKSVTKEQEKPLAGSRFAKFAAKGSGIAEHASAATGKVGSKVKYTPLEQQVIALKQANPGVILAVEVRPLIPLRSSVKQANPGVILPVAVRGSPDKPHHPTGRL